MIHSAALCDTQAPLMCTQPARDLAFFLYRGLGRRGPRGVENYFAGNLGSKSVEC